MTEDKREKFLCIFLDKKSQTHINEIKIFLYFCGNF